jgi:microcin C transport system substrate-binding protein
VPNWHLNRFRIAYRHTLARPEISPPYGLPLDAWWQKP